MFLIAAIGLTAFFICLMTTPLVRDVFSRAQLLDHPDDLRKFHRRAMPRVGGIAIVLSFMGALALARGFAPQLHAFPMHRGGLLLALLPATALMFLTGLVDDLKTLKPWQKLLGQGVSSALAVFFGAHLAIPHAPLWLSFAISFVWLLVCTNAFNLIDGIDGLASGAALFATLAILLAALLNANLVLALAAASLAGCLFAFLRYNFHPASIFLGDCGSLTIGFMLGCFALDWSQHAKSVIDLGAPIVMLALPLFDVVLALGRRFLRNAPLFHGDRHHIHHKVLARALTTRKAVVILYGVSAVTAAMALLLSASQPQFKPAILFLFCALALVGIANLRYIEFSAALRTVRRRSLRRHIREEIYLDELQIALAKADTVEAIWDVVCVACEDLRFATLKMRLHDRVFHVAIDLENTEQAWTITIPLGQSGELCLTRAGKMRQTDLMVAVLDRLQAAIAQKVFFHENAEAEEPVFSYQGAA